MLSRNLRPSVLDHLGLAAGLRHLADGLRESGIDVATTVDGDARALGDRERTALFRIAQEAMTNIRRHSRAGHVEVELIVRPKEALLVIRDDGVGFAVDAPALRPSASSSRLGLAGMHERAAMLGGTLELSSAAGSGTCVRAAIPLDPGTGPRDPHRGAT